MERYRALSPVRCFEGEIRQVLSNLVSNGLDAMAANGGRLFVRTRIATNWIAAQRGVVITVADEGTGISQVSMAKLFTPFFTTKGITGNGLGLWVSREIIDRHKGALRVRSRQANGASGTVFALFLPFDAATR